MFDLKQLVNFPTHNSGHTLDLFITRCVTTLMFDVDFGIHPFTDHYSIHSVMNGPRFNRSPTIKKQIRAIKSIDPAAFSTDILASPLYSVPPSDLQSYSTLFSTALSSLLESMHHLKPFLTPRGQINHLLLLKFFVKKLNVPNLNQFINQ